MGIGQKIFDRPGQKFDRGMGKLRDQTAPNSSIKVSLFYLSQLMVDIGIFKDIKNFIKMLFDSLRVWWRYALRGLAIFIEVYQVWLQNRILK